MSSSGSSAAEAKALSVLFVCLGNICRSPAAEAVFTHLVNKRGLSSKFIIDSAGTINYHQFLARDGEPTSPMRLTNCGNTAEDPVIGHLKEGNEADPRMKAAAKRRGIQITSISRPIRSSDFREFDLILAMDTHNKDDILGALKRWKVKENLPPDCDHKVRLMCSYCKKHAESEVPDPYYGGAQGFEKVLDILEDGCESLLDNILEDQQPH